MDQNSFLTRAKRYVRVTSSVGLSASKTVALYLSGRLDPKKHAEEIKNLLGNLRGPIMKIAQIVATVPDLLPDDYEMELMELQSNAPPMNPLFVKRRMRSELGENWLANFQTFDEKAAHAASLGQVHRATLVDGRLVACKLQYPDMAASVEADLGEFKLLLGLYESYRPGLETADVFAEVADRLHEELDYQNEARNLKIFQKIFAGDPHIHTPDVVDELTTTRLLTMSWVDGQRLTSLVDEPQAVRNQIAERLFQGWYQPFYRYGVIHGDPHLGNYLIRKDRLYLLDFGCVRFFKGAFIEGVIDLYKALRDSDAEAEVAAFEKWGFTHLNKEVLAALRAWALYLYDPLLDDRTRLIQEDGSPARAKQMAADLHKTLRQHGKIKPPREFVFTDRAAIGLGAAFLRLGAKLNWHRMYEEMIAGVTAKGVDGAQRKIVEPL